MKRLFLCAADFLLYYYIQIFLKNFKILLDIMEYDGIMKNKWEVPASVAHKRAPAEGKSRSGRAAPAKGPASGFGKRFGRARQGLGEGRAGGGGRIVRREAMF
ncbi:MAG: hypothetical protein LBD95_04195 [Clostridiales Family XIII bacterium]|nr:hypothetical protein [Clostridiales Family XIII bacterium]